MRNHDPYNNVLHHSPCVNRLCITRVLVYLFKWTRAYTDVWSMGLPIPLNALLNQSLPKKDVSQEKRTMLLKSTSLCI